MEKVDFKKVLLGTGAALVANVGIYLLGNSAGATWSVGLPFTLGVPIIAMATIAPMVVGSQAVRLISKWKPNFIKISAWLGLIFSIVGAPGGWIASNDLTTGLALGSMHVTVGVAWFYSIRATKS